MDTATLTERITVTKTLITNYETAVAAIGAGGATASYTLDTGQGRQVVTRANLTELNRTLDSLYNRLSMFQKRLNGDAVVGRPGWPC